MRHAILGTIFLSATLLQPGPAAAQAPSAGPDLGANAALKYWQALQLLPPLDKNQEKILENWSKVPLDAASRELVGKGQMSLEYLRRGARLPRCDWGLEYGDGVRLVLPHMTMATTLSRLAALSARHEFAQGRWKAGADDVAALLGLARHVETDRLFIPYLVGCRIESIAIETAAPYLPQLKETLPSALSAVLDASPPGPTLAEIVLMEKQVAPSWLARELRAAEAHEKGSWHAVWKGVFEAPNEKGPDADEASLKTIKTFEQAIAALDDLVPWYDLLAQMTTLPRAEFDAQYLDFAKKSRVANPLAGILMPGMDRLVEVQRRTDARRALFNAALAVVQRGPDALKTIQDPFGDAPFEYRALDQGFELKSKLIFRGQPVTLTVGQGTKS